MTVNQLKFRLNKIASSQTHSECALLCRDLLEDAVSYIFDKAESSKPKNASLLELIDHTAVTSYINDADTVNALHYARILGMNAKHGRKVRKNEAKLAQENVTYLIGLLAAKETGTEHAYRYTDDGWSGGNFERPAWKQLIADIEARKVGIVLAKDMSRIGRDYLQTGFYTDV